MTVQRHWDTLDRITMESYARPTMATIVYIDGFNLYYGALRGSPSKWLDLEALSRRLLPKDDIHLIRYFTAPASPPDPTTPNRRNVKKPTYEPSERSQECRSSMATSSPTQCECPSPTHRREGPAPRR
jgi:hypothetical protein